MPIEKPDTVGELRRIALATFARHGIDGTTVQEVADEAGCAKSNVLYHFGSKTGLVEAALSPGVEALGAFVERVERGEPGASISDPDAVAAFVDLVVEHRQAVHLFINRSAEIPEGALLERIADLTARLDALLVRSPGGDGERLALSVLLGGVVFVLAGPLCPPDEELPIVRDRLLAVVGGLLAAAPRRDA